MQHLPETRNPAAANGRAIAKQIISNPESSDTLLDLQAHRVQKLYFLSFETACTIASLAYAGCPR